MMNSRRRYPGASSKPTQRPSARPAFAAASAASSCWCAAAELSCRCENDSRERSPECSRSVPAWLQQHDTLVIICFAAGERVLYCPGIGDISACVHRLLWWSVSCQVPSVVEGVPEHHVCQPGGAWRLPQLV
jgi:hypothetical protein